MADRNRSFGLLYSLLCRLLLKYQTRVSHDLIITDHSYGSCLILIYTACGCYVHVSCHEAAKGLTIISSLQNCVYVYECHYRDLGTYT